MANPLPPLLVTFDTDVLMASRTQVWQEYAKVGTCYIPEVVYDEIDRLTDQAVEPAIEQVAREFMRFFADSGWIATDAQQTHRALEPSIKNQGKQAMLVVATAQCVYGLAQEHPEALVIFVSNSQPLLKRLASVGSYESLRDYRGDAVKLGEERGTPAGGDSAIAKFDAHPHGTQSGSAL
jgi:hypothetical protein